MADALFLTGMALVGFSVTALHVLALLDGSHILFRI